MKRILLIGISLFFLASGGFAQVKIKDAQLLNQKVKEFQKAEWDIQIKGSFDNPYDQHEVALDMLLTSPSGKPLLLPCYFVKQEDEIELWKARFTPQEKGTYTYRFRLSAGKMVNFTDTTHFKSVATSGTGFLHKNNLWTFKFDNGKIFRGIGENVAWESRSFENPKWTYNYLLPKLANNGANFFRTWMCWWNLPLEWQQVSSTKRYQSTQQFYNPGGIKRMDKLVEMTDSLGLYMMLTLDMNSGNWNHSPYNRINGGPISRWRDFFTSQKAMDRYKDKLRYIVARWGYSTHIAAWEFFNEIDNGVFTAG